MGQPKHEGGTWILLQSITKNIMYYFVFALYKLIRKCEWNS